MIENVLKYLAGRVWAGISVYRPEAKDHVTTPELLALIDARNIVEKLAA